MKSIAVFFFLITNFLYFPIYTYGMQNLGPFAAQPAFMAHIGNNQTANLPVNINVWDNATLINVINQIFQQGAFGNVGAPPVPILNQNVINQMNLCFQNQGCSHLAIMRIVIIDGNNIGYVYPIPYVFVSGIDGGNAINRWAQRLLPAHVSLNNAINNVNIPFGGARPIDNLVKGISDYAFSCALQGQFQFYAHSERTAILCLLYDINQSVEDAVNALPGGTVIQRIVIQIKIAHPTRVCAACRSFINANAVLDNANGNAIAANLNPIFGGNIRNAVSPVIDFSSVARTPVLRRINFTTRLFVNTKSNNVPPLYPIHLRISNDNNNVLVGF